MGVNAVFDSVGKDTFEGSLNSLKVRGLMVCLGTASGSIAPFNPQMLAGKGGLVAHLGTNSMIQVMERIGQGDEKARVVKDAMCYGIVKQIGAMAAAMCGRVDAVILTGGIAHNEFVVRYIEQHCSFIAPVSVYPGENELESLVANALVVLRGTIVPKVYA